MPKRIKPVAKRSAGETNRIPVGFRISPTLRQWLKEAATKNGRSLSQEAEHRMEMSFEVEGIVKETIDLCFGAYGRSVLTIGSTLQSMQTIREMKESGAIDEAGAQLMLTACEQGLIDNLNKMIGKAGGK